MKELITKIKKFDENIKIIELIDESTFRPKLKINYGNNIVLISFSVEQIIDLKTKGLSMSILIDVIITELKKTKYYLRKKKIKNII